MVSFSTQQFEQLPLFSAAEHGGTKKPAADPALAYQPKGEWGPWIPPSEQHPMFMTGREIQKAATHSADTLPSERSAVRDRIPSAPSGQIEKLAMASMWRRKETESRRPINPEDGKWGQAHGAGVYDSVAKQGVQTPVSLRRSAPGDRRELSLGDGHHRVASAGALERENEDAIANDPDPGRIRDPSVYVPVLEGYRPPVVDQNSRGEWPERGGWRHGGSSS